MAVASLPQNSVVLQGHYDKYSADKANLDTKRVMQLKPIDQLDKQINQIKERVTDADDIFSRKFQLVQDQVNSMIEKIQEDKAFQSEIHLVRQ